MLNKDVYNLTNSQQNIWDTELFFSNSNLNNIGGYVFIEEKVNFNLLEKALCLYVKKNDALRLKIKLIDGIPYQYLEDFSPFNIDLISLNNINEVELLNEKIIKTPFSLIDSTLFSITMFKLPNGFGGFNATLHHLISDAWNMSLLINEIMNLYSSLMQNHEPDDSLNPSYIEYIVSQKDYLNSSRFKKDEEFWNSMFDKEPDISYISKKNRNELDTKSRRKIFKLSNELYNEINALCRTFNCSIYTFFMSIYSLYLSKINNTSSPVLGTPVLNRSGFKEKHTSGMFISTVPFKVTLDLNNTFSQFLKDVALTQISIFKHQKYPYNKLLQNIKKKYNLSENLYDLVLSYQNARDDNKSSDIKYHSKWLEPGRILDSLEIHFYDMDNTGSIDIFYDYQLNKFSESDIENIHLRIMNMIELVLKQPDILIKDIKIVDKKEEQLILSEFNNTNFNYDKNKTILQVFEENVRNNPAKAALVFENQCYTYSELNQLSNKLAHYLLSLNIPKNSVIGFMLERSINTIIAMLATLKANMAYMLIEKSLPEDRIIYMLKNAKSPLLVTSSNMNFVNFDKKVYIEDIDFDKLKDTNLDVSDKPEDYLSVVYTSGSTGLPKGVLIKRFSMVNLVNGYKKSMETDKLTSFLSICSVAFDMFAAEVWIALISGKKLVLSNEEQSKNPIEMSKLIEKNECEFMLITSSKMDLLLSDESTINCLKYLKAIQLGGEILTSKFYNKVTKFTNARIYNGYGPSETTSCCSCKYVTSSEDINIGKPLPNVNIYICNNYLNLCPIGITGELCIGGDGVSYGYINNQEMTSKSFIKNPFGDGLLYKSGDLARWNSNGDIEYIGRNDFQIKIRGLRVELEEINNAIKSLPQIDNSITIIRKLNNIDTICSFVVSSHNDSVDLKNKLSKLLPHYMIPSHIVFMDNLPLTINGKIDTNNLPEIKIATKYVEPQTQTQRNLVSIFEKVLNINKISIDDNFFDIGGDSLSGIRIVTQLSSMFNISLSIKSIFDFPTVAMLAEYIDSLNQNTSEDIIEKVADSDSYPASFAQKRIYYTVQIEGKNSLTYNTPGGIVFDKVLDYSKLEKCIQQLISRHDALRTYFVLEDSDLKQKILDSYDFKLKINNAKDSELDDIFSDFINPFDLSKAPLFRMEFISLDSKKSVLLVDMHHIICDGYSISIFINELCKLYNEQSLPEKEIDYKDYSNWEINKFKSDDFKESENYWVSQFKNEIPILNMPTAYSRGTSRSFDGENIYKKIESTHIKSFCKKFNTTPYMFLLSIYYILLYKYTMQNDIVVGTPVAGREHTSLQNIIGMFVNTLALKQHISPDIKLSEFIKNVSSYCIDSFNHQAYPFDELVKNLHIKRDLSRNPLFDTMFIYQNDGDSDLTFKDVSANYYKPDNHTSKFDFSLEITPNTDYFDLRLEYCKSLYDMNFMNQFLEHYTNIIDFIINNDNVSIKEIDMLSNVERNNILNVFNDTTYDYDFTKTIYKLFEEQANKTPEYIAVTFKDSTLTYKELDEKSNQLAWYLSSIGIGRGSIVGIMLPRSLEVLISILAVLKTGACYIPIDPSFPRYRIEYMLKNSQCNLLLTTNDLLLKINFNNILDVGLTNKDVYSGKSSSLNTSSLPDDPSYIIYTSGSTGKPKGVMLNHKALTNLAFYLNSKVEFLKNDYKNMSIASVTTISFDIFIFETLICLQKGLNIVFSTEDEQTSPNLLNDLIFKNNVKAIQMTPSRMQFFIDNIDLIPHISDLEYVVLAGESLPNELLNSLLKLGIKKVYNGYGPSETTVFSSFTDVTNYTNVTIGRPLNNTKFHILDNDKNLVPVGVPGEIYISGDGLALEYINNPEITKNSFIDNPFEKNSLMYKTGDFAKYSQDGEVHYICRVDHQIKIRGLRIELEEIRNAILQYPNVEKALLVAQKNKDREFLVAYIIQNDRVSINKLKGYLKNTLPHYMVPSYFMILDDFPYLPNGKIDKKSLPIPNLADSSLKRTYIAPKTEIEIKVANIFQQILSISPIGVNDNFFDLGGDSLLAMHLQVELMKFTKNISYSDIFMYPTVHDLAKRIQTYEKSHYSVDNSDVLYNLNGIIKDTTKFNQDIKYQLVGNVLLSGVTGFLGAHILDSFLKNENGKIYCIIRKEPGMSIKDKFLRKLHFYFGKKYDSLIDNRIILLSGDLIKYHFGLSDEDYSMISKNVDCVINSAALVSHYGNYKLYKTINVDGTENILEFAKQFNKRFYQISTLSVSGNSLADQSFIRQNFENDVIFNENNFYVSQNLDNVYVRSKFEAEKLVLENIKTGLDGYILRIGNLMGRFSDGTFQKNVDENAYINRLISFSKIKSIPDYLLSGYLEFTPVDCCADAILKIIQHSTTNNRVFHLLNPNVINLDEFLKLYCKRYEKIDIISNVEFKKRMKHILSLENADSLINGIISDLDENMELVYGSKIKLNSEFTEKYLKNIGFKWPKIDTSYIIKFFDYLSDLGYIKKDI